MARPTRNLESKALKLSPRERARLAHRLIAILDQGADGNTEKLLRDETARQTNGVHALAAAGCRRRSTARRR